LPHRSGQGVKQPPITQLKPTALQPMFSFVKGSVERDLGGVPGFTRGVTAVRPGMILGRKGVYNEHLENFVNGRFGSWLGNTAFAVQSDDIARALVQSVVAPAAAARTAAAAGAIEVLENNDIKERAKEQQTAAAVVV
jgi:hypothetical protein